MFTACVNRITSYSIAQNRNLRITLDFLSCSTFNPSGNTISSTYRLYTKVGPFSFLLLHLFLPNHLPSLSHTAEPPYKLPPSIFSNRNLLKRAFNRYTWNKQRKKERKNAVLDYYMISKYEINIHEFILI